MGLIPRVRMFNVQAQAGKAGYEVMSKFALVSVRGMHSKITITFKNPATAMPRLGAAV